MEKAVKLKKQTRHVCLLTLLSCQYDKYSVLSTRKVQFNPFRAETIISKSMNRQLY